MTFREQLVRYMEALKVNGSQLAQVTGMTPASISRYRTGIRVPAPESEIVNKLAQGLAALASDRGMPGFEEREIVQSLNEGIREDFASNPSAHVNYKILQGNLDRLMEELNLSGKDLAAAVHYDVSQIYRIRNGKRNPSNPARFVESVVRYVLQTCSSKSERAIIAHLIGWSGAIEGDPSDSQGECSDISAAGSPMAWKAAQGPKSAAFILRSRSTCIDISAMPKANFPQNLTTCMESDAMKEEAVSTGPCETSCT